MTLVDVICVVFGVLGVLFGFRCWAELWKWAKVSQRAQIAIAYKNKVKVNHPIQEWMLMVNLLQPDETGRTVYALGGTRVAILRGAPITLRNELLRFLRHRKPQAQPQKPRTGNVVGTWDAKDDKTGATRKRSE